MDLDEDLLMIQGILNNANKLYGPFENIIIRGGNERKIESIMKKLSDYLVSKKYIKKDKVNPKFIEVLRKITFFLLLNSDLSTQNILQEERNIGHLVAITPKMTKCLLMELVWGLNLGPYFCEIIIHCPISITYELLETIVLSVKYAKPYAQLERVNMLVHAMFSKIYLLEDEKVYKIAFQHVTSGLFRSIVELLQYYINPNVDNMKDWAAKELYEYTGYAMTYILQLTYDSLFLYCKKLANETIINLDIYQLECDYGDETYCSSENRIEKIDQTLKNCNACLISSCRANITAISVNIFCSWAEVQFKKSNKTLQEAVGNHAYLLCDLLKEVDDPSAAELSSMLLSISLKPKNIDDEIRIANIDTVIKHVQIPSETQKKWLKKLLCFQCLLTEEKVLSCLKNYINICDCDDIIHILNQCRGEISHSPEKSLVISELAYFCVQHLLPSQYLTVLTAHFNKNIDNLFESKNFNEALTELLNKVVYTEELDKIYKDFLNLILENPVSVINALFESGLKNKQHVEIIVDILKFLEPIYNLHSSLGKPIAVASFKRMFDKDVWTEAEKQTLFIFIEKLASAKIIEPKVMAEDALLINIHMYLNEFDLEKVHLCIEACRVICGTESFYPLAKPFLCYMSEVLEQTRWDILKYSSIAVTIVQTITQIVNQIVQKIKSKNIKENNLEYMKNQLRGLSRINRFYFRLLWDDSGMNLFTYVWPGNLNERSRTWNIARMHEVLPFCTTEEWVLMVQEMLKQKADALEIFNMLIDFLLLQTVVMNNSHNKASLACFEYTIKNFSIVLKDCILSRISTCYNAELVVWQQILHLSRKFPKPIQKSSNMTILNVLIPVLESLKEKNEDVKSIMIFDIIPISNTEMCEILCKKLLANAN